MKLKSLCLLFAMLLSFAELSAHKDRVEAPVSYTFIFQNADSILNEPTNDTLFEQLSHAIAIGQKKLLKANFYFKTGESIQINYDSFRLTEFALINKKGIIKVPDSIIQKLHIMHYSSLVLLWNSDSKKSWNANYSYIRIDIGKEKYFGNYLYTTLFFKESLFSNYSVGKEASIYEYYQNELERIKLQCQKELDTGDKMLRTSKRYCFQMDSLLTLIYSEVCKSNLPQIDAIKKEQTQYYVKRKIAGDSLFSKADVIFEEHGIYPQLEEMVAYGEIGDMNFKRALSLIDFMKEL